MPAVTKSGNKLLRYGAPMVLFCLVGYVGLTKFVEGKYEAADQRVKKRSARAVELEQAHKAIVGKLSLDEFEIKPISRPKEE